jgi:hypothetical protein
MNHTLDQLAAIQGFSFFHGQISLLFDFKQLFGIKLQHGRLQGDLVNGRDAYHFIGKLHSLPRFHIALVAGQ